MKKILLPIAVAVTLLTATQSCKLGGSGQDITLIPVQTGVNFEYINQEGKIVINPQFGDACLFEDNIALVQNNGDTRKWGYIDIQGKYIVTPQYIQGTVFSEGLAWVVPENGNPQTIDKNGVVKFTIKDVETVRIFKEGLAAVKVEQNGKELWGFIDNKGGTKINPQFTSVGFFSNGLCAVENTEEKWGYIDASGKYIINPQFDAAGDYRDGMAVVKLSDKVGAIDKAGKYAINPQFTSMYSDHDRFLIALDGKWGWCDKTGKILINPQFSAAYPFYDHDLAAVRTDKTWGYIDKEGKFAINPQFEVAYPFSGKIAAVEIGDKVGFINSTGKFAINPQFDELSDDYDFFLSTGRSSQTSVESDYFNVNAIADLIKQEVNENGVNGLRWDAPYSTIMQKYHVTADSLSKYSDNNKVISAKRMGKGLAMDFFVLGNPFENYTDLLPNSNATGYGYLFTITGKGSQKVYEIVKQLESSFPGYTKEYETSSGDSTIVFKNAYQTANIYKNVAVGKIAVVITPKVARSPYEE